MRPVEVDAEGSATGAVNAGAEDGAVDAAAHGPRVPKGVEVNVETAATTTTVTVETAASTPSTFRRAKRPAEPKTKMPYSGSFRKAKNLNDIKPSVPC